MWRTRLSPTACCSIQHCRRDLRPAASSLRYIAAIATALALAACDETPSFSHYVLALSWQPAFCETHDNKPECRAMDGADFAAGNLALHGLWPSDTPTDGPSYCGVSASIRPDDEPARWCELPQTELSAVTRASLQHVMP